MIQDEDPHPWPDTTLANLVRVVNVLTAISGLVASFMLGFFMLFTGTIFIATILLWPTGLGMLALLPVLYWGCGGYGAAFTRFERFPLPRLTFQTLVMGTIMTACLIHLFRKPSLPVPASSWDVFLALLAIAMAAHACIAFVTHLLSLSALLYFRFTPNHPNSGSSKLRGHS